MRSGRTRARCALALCVLAAGWLCAGRGEAQQGARVAPVATTWQTAPGGDPSGDHLHVELGVREGSLRGSRRVESVDAPGGYTSGTVASIVLSGSEPVARRTLRVHLPYGAAIDLAPGDVVEVSMRSERRGLGTACEVLVRRGGHVVVLQTSQPAIAGVRAERGARASVEGARTTYARRVTIGGHALDVAPHALLYYRPQSLLVQGVDVEYGAHRPPDAFDEHTVTLVRIRPPAAH